MSLLWPKITVIAICTFAVLDVAAQRSELDDSLSPRQDYALELAWSPEQMNQALAALFASDDVALPLLRGRLRDVEVRLDVRKFVGERVRVYMNIPGSIAGDSGSSELEAEFRGRGAFESGTVRPGQEALIFDGVIEETVLGGAFDFAISLSSSGANQSFNFELKYEIEVLN